MLIYWELCKRLKFDPTNKLYKHKSECSKNEMHKILWRIEIQMDHPILTKRSDLVLIIKKRMCQLVDFTIHADLRITMKEREKMDKYWDLARELKKQWNMKMMVLSIVISALRIELKALEKRLGELEVRGRIKSIQITVLLEY